MASAAFPLESFPLLSASLARRVGIYYNTLLLSRVYEQKLAAGDLEAIRILKSTSPVAWHNINLIGNFDFTANSSPVHIEALAARYQNEDFWRHDRRR
jgi:hypothetical protein